MAYSKMTDVLIYNFMSFKEAKVSFDETGIINLKGFNDSGKSTVLRAIAVCLMDAFKRKQAKFIRYGEDYFRVVVSFDDGVSIIRDKYSNGQSLYEVRKNGDTVFSTKVGNKLTKIDGVPKVIEDYLGLCVTDQTYFNYQSCVDSLPLVDYTGSENYQTVHEVLKVEDIFRAVQLINTDRNTLGAEITNIEGELQRKEVLLEKCGGVTEDFIEVIEELESESENTLNRKSKLESVADTIGKYLAVPDIPKIDKMSDAQLKNIVVIKNILVNLDTLKDIPKIDKVQVSKLFSLESIAGILNKLGSYIELPSLNKMSLSDTERMKSLVKISKVYGSYMDSLDSCKGIDDSLAELRDELNLVVEDAKEKGISFVKCSNCGTYNVVGGTE